MSMNTVFVIGAGASKEANLPIGDELKSKIATLLGMGQKGGEDIVEALHISTLNDGTANIKPYLEAARHIKDALPLAISIDNFIDAHRDNNKIALCGKLAITLSILDAEKRSLLNFKKVNSDSNIDFGNLENTWYIPFFQLLTANCGKNDLKDRFESITLIIFNYDRCVEHFIYCALQNYYKISEAEAAELIKIIKIYHPYGNVGTLPWINQNGSMEFGKEPGPQKLLQLAQKIKTFAEGTDPNSSEISNIRRHIALAYRVVFLGFAFHKLNMQLIYPGNFDAGKIVSCYATAYELSDSDKLVIKEQIEDIYKRTIILEMAKSNVRCCQFFKEFWRSLAF